MNVLSLSWAGLSEDRGASWTKPRLHVNISAPLHPLRNDGVLLHLDFVTMVTDAASGGGGGESSVFIRANCTDI